MVNVYRSMMAVVNIVFTAAMVLLAFRFWTETQLTIQILIVLGIILFPVIQPLMIYLRSKKIVRSMPENMRIDFSNKEMVITSEEKKSQVEYKELKSVIRIAGMLIIYTRIKQGFILNGEVLGDKGTPLFDFLVKKLNNQN